jgi:outer membrane protein assembly factor BamB
MSRRASRAVRWGALAFLSLLVASIALSPHPPGGMPGALASTRVDWTTMNSDAHGTDYVAQSQLGVSNVRQLQYAWTFQFPLSPIVPGLDVTGQGAISPPLVVQGIVYVVTNFLTVYAINGQTGNLVWSYAPQLNTTGLPLGPLAGHMHGINYYRGNIWVSMPDCSVDAIDAATGALVMKISEICKDIPGNSGLYDSSGVPPVFDGDTMIWTSSVSEGTNVGRGFVAAYSISSGDLLWRWYVAPPSGGDPGWDTNSCPPPCHGNVTPFSGDWGAMGTTTVINGTTNNVLVGAGPGFGDPVVDTRRGVVFVSTSQASPDWNGTYRPGPDLYSDSVVALNATDGSMLWFYQTTPHDLYDFDCGWNTVLGNATVGGVQSEAVFKACKNGYLYALDASTGSLLWYFDPPTVARSFTGNANYVVTRDYSADLAWANYPSTDQFEQCPGENGAVESDIAFAYSMVYVASYNLCTYVQVGPVSSAGGQVMGVTYLQPSRLGVNTTIYGVDASTGRAVWNYSIPAYPFRGWLTVSNGLLYAGSPDGKVHILDALTGAPVYSLAVGPPLYDSPTLGTAANGKIHLYQLVSSASEGAIQGPVPGELIAFELPGSPNSPWPATTVIAGVAVAAASAAVAYGWLRWKRRR